MFCKRLPHKHPGLHAISLAASRAFISQQCSFCHLRLPAVPALAAPPPGSDFAAACQLAWQRPSILGSIPFCRQVWSLLCQAAMAAFPILLFPASGAASAKCTVSIWRGLVVCVPPACCAPPLVLLIATQSDCGWVQVVRVPLLQQPAVCCDGAAATEPAKLDSAVAEGAYDAACCLQPGKAIHHCIPLMHLATSGTAVALQPDPLVAAMSVTSRPAGSVLRGVPPPCDAVVVRVGQGLAALLPIPAICPYNVSVTADQQCPSQFSRRKKGTRILWADTARSDTYCTLLSLLFCSSGRVGFGSGCVTS